MTKSRQRYFTKDEKGDLRLRGEYDEKADAIIFFKRSRELNLCIQGKTETTPLISQEEKEPTCWDIFTSLFSCKQDQQPEQISNSNKPSKNSFF